MISIEDLREILAALPLELAAAGWTVLEDRTEPYAFGWYDAGGTQEAARFRLATTATHGSVRADLRFLTRHLEGLVGISVKVHDEEEGRSLQESVLIEPRARWSLALVLTPLERLRLRWLASRPGRKAPRSWEDRWSRVLTLDKLLRVAQKFAHPLRLQRFALACCLRVRELMDNRRSHRFLDTVEKYFLGRTSLEEVLFHQKRAEAASAREACHERASAPHHAAHAAALVLDSPLEAARHAAWAAARWAGAPDGYEWQVALQRERESQKELLHEVLGDPLRPIGVDAAWLRWRGGLVPTMAHGILQDHAFDQLPVLADALEDAGCRCEPLLEHCRQPEGHVVGCWALDLLASGTRSR